VANYGDLGIALPKDWNRRAQSDQVFVLNTIGHAEGKADVWRKGAPDEEHQFAWVEPRYREEIQINRSKGYEFVKQGEWEKIDLWEWDAEGFLIRADGQRLMARPKDKFLEDMADRRAQRSRVMGSNRDDEEAARMAAKHGIEISGDDGKPIRRVKGGLRG
jgi:hypothetical protein